MRQFSHLFRLTFALCALLLAGCTAARVPVAAQSDTLAPLIAASTEATPTHVSDVALLGVITIPNDTMAFETLVGGLSAITYAGEGNTFYLLADDRAINGPTRIYEATVDVSDGRLDDGDLIWTKLIALQDESGKLFVRGAIDPEGLVYTDDGFFVSTEGEAAAQPLIAPAILHFTVAGEFVASLPLPDKFIPLTDGSRGVRNNQSLESLTITPNGHTLISGVENALVQDGPAATLDEESPVRLFTFDLVEQRVIQEQVYIVDTVPHAPTPPDGDADNGLVDLIALDDHGTLLALERAYAQGVGNSVRLYIAHTQHATDVSGMESLITAAPVTPIAKTRVVDFGELGSDLGIAPDNLEGMALGPQLPDGRYLLLVVSDNNFSANQTTQLWALAITIAR